MEVRCFISKLRDFKMMMISPPFRLEVDCTRERALTLLKYHKLARQAHSALRGKTSFQSISKLSHINEKNQPRRRFLYNALLSLVKFAISPGLLILTTFK